MTTTSEITVLADKPIDTKGSWVDGAPYLPSSEIERTLGWELKPEGLCKGDACIPLGDKVHTTTDGTHKLVQIANLVGRPCLADEATGIVTQTLNKITIARVKFFVCSSNSIYFKSVYIANSKS